MRGTGAPRARESVPSSEAGWKQPETGRNTFSCVEDTHPTALGYSFSLSCLVSLDDPGRSQKEILHQNWAQGTIWKLPQAGGAVFLPGCLGERTGTNQYIDPILTSFSTEAEGLFI